MGMIGVASGPGCGRGVVAVSLPSSMPGMSDRSIFIAAMFWLAAAGLVDLGMFFCVVVMPGIFIPAIPDMSMPFISPIFIPFILPMPMSAIVRIGNRSIGGTAAVMPVLGASVPRAKP